MSKNQVVWLLIGCLFFQNAWSQNEKDTLVVQFHLKWNEEPLLLNRTYFSSNHDTLQISKFKCYVSKIEIQYADKSVAIPKNNYVLIDAEEPKSFRIPIVNTSKKPVSKITFNIGIDSIASVSGALEGTLDPSNGMYWAWQSGYINMKIEGKSPSCLTRKNEFHFHLGGYLPPFYALRKVDLNSNNSRNIIIGIDLARFFSTIDLSETNSIMVPGKTAMQLADTVAKLFYIE